MTCMYAQYFALTEAPFSIAPSPRFLYMSQRHQEALAHLRYGLGGEGGFVLLTGEVGAGKTTVCRGLLEQLPDSCDLAYVFNPKLNVVELLATLCAEFAIECPTESQSVKAYVDRINAHLLAIHAQGRHAVLIIDEAQSLSADVLEALRLLTNLETSERKLLQIILIGQPELAAMLARPDLRQLAQRIVARYHLEPLGKAEVAAYVRHRLEVAGTQRPLFPPRLMRRIYRLTGGVPRLINVLCDRALLGAFVQGKERVDAATLAQAAREAFHPLTFPHRFWPRALAAGLLLVTGGSLAVVAYRQADRVSSVPATAVVVNAPASARPLDTPTPGAQGLVWPSGSASLHAEEMAHGALFSAWGLAYGGGELCAEAARHGLRCRAGRGGLAELRQINRPALLRLRDEQGRSVLATLLALDTDSASFALAGQRQDIALAELALRWSGEYRLLWRPPPLVTGPIRPGDRGAAVLWLRALLGETGEKGEAHYDSALVDRVKQFQLAQGLIPDGSVGAQTLIRLLGALDRGAPTLSGTGGDS